MRESGIRVVVSEKVSDSGAAYSGKKAFLVSLVCWVYLLLGEWGVLFTLNETFALGVSYTELIKVTVLVSAGAALLMSVPKWKLYGLLVQLAFCVGFFIYCWDKLTVGFVYIWEAFGIKFDLYFNDGSDLIPSLRGIEDQVQLAMTGMSLLLAVFMGSAIFLWRSPSVSLVLFLLLDAVILVVGLMPPVWTVLIQLLALLGIGMLGGCRNRQAIFGTVTRIDTRIGLRQKMQLQISLGMLLMAAVVMFLVVSLLLQPVYARVEAGRENMNQLREDIQNFTIDDWDDFGFSITGHASMGLNGGKLGNYQSISGKRKEDLYITSDVSYPGTVYVKGFSGGLYAGDRWEQIAFQDWAKNYYGTGNWELVPEEHYISPEYVRLNQLKAQLEDGEQIVLSQAMKVEVVKGSDAYSYLPGFPQASVFGETIPLYGWAEQVSPTASYVTALASPSWLLEQLGVVETDVPPEAYSYDSVITITKGHMTIGVPYEQFVRENYLQVPEQALNRVRADWESYLQEHPLQGEGAMSVSSQVSDVNAWVYEGGVTYTELVNRICSYLASKAVYTTSPGKTPNGEDFIDYFLFEQEKGYCMHFASTAVMLFRMYGVPARYVEGYTVEGLAAGVKTIVMDTQAHAWCEIYVRGFGWVTVDVTPGGRLLSNTPGTEEGQETQTETVTETEIVTVPEEEATPQPETSNQEESQEQPSPLPGQNNVVKPGASGHIGTELLEKLLTVLGIIGLLILVWIGIRKRSQMLLRRRMGRMRQNSCRLAILAAYRYTTRLAGSLPRSVETDLSMEGFQAHFPDGDQALFAQWQGLVQEAYFSRHEMTEENCETVLAFYRYIYQSTLTVGTGKKTANPLIQRCRRFWRTYGSCYPMV